MSDCICVCVCVCTRVLKIDLFEKQSCRERDLGRDRERDLSTGSLPK